MNAIQPRITPEDYDRLRDRAELWLPLLQEIARETGSDPDLKPFSEGSNVVFASGRDRVIKVYPLFLACQFEAERRALPLVHGRVPVTTPRLIQSGHHQSWPYLVMERLGGQTLSSRWTELSAKTKSQLLHQLGGIVAAHHRIEVREESIPGPIWDRFIESQISGCVSRHKRLGVPERLVKEMPEFIQRHLQHASQKPSRPVLLTGEYTPGNILIIQEAGEWKIRGLIDYGDSMIGFHEYDLLGPGTFLICGSRELLESFLDGYGYEKNKRTEAFARRLTSLLLLHRYSNLDVQVAIPGWKEKVSSLEELQKILWPL